MGGAVLLGLLLSNDNVRTYWSRKQYLIRLQKRLDAMRRSNQTLAMEIRRLETDSKTLERHARRELGMVQPGEIEYRFISKKSDKD